MKKLIFSTLIVLAVSTQLYAQSCTTGFCPTSITVHHKAGTISPVSGDYTYTVIATTAFGGGTKCFLQQNLGASTLPTGYNDATTTAQGWYWQYGNAQGFKATQTSNPSLTPSSGFQTSYANLPTSWTTATDPCTLLLGAGWYIPSYLEWGNLATAYPLMTTGSTGPGQLYSQGIKLNATGCLTTISGTISWSSGGTTGYSYSQVLGANTPNTMIYMTSASMYVGAWYGATSGYYGSNGLGYIAYTTNPGPSIGTSNVPAFPIRCLRVQ